MRRVKRARTPFFFRYCFTFERSSLWGKEKKKKEKEERRKKSLSRIGQWNFSLPERIVETIFLKLGTRIRNFPFLSRLFQPIDPSGIKLSNFLFPDIRNRCSSSLDNDKWKIEENLFLFFFWRILRSFQTRNSLVYLFRVIIISTLQPSKILSLNIKRRTNIRKCFPFFQPPCFLFATRTAGKFLRKLSVQKNSFSRLFEYSNRAQWRQILRRMHTRKMHEQTKILLE